MHEIALKCEGSKYLPPKISTTIPFTHRPLTSPWAPTPHSTSHLHLVHSNPPGSDTQAIGNARGDGGHVAPVGTEVEGKEFARQGFKLGRLGTFGLDRFAVADGFCGFVG